MVLPSFDPSDGPSGLGPRPRPRPDPVPWRTILATIALVLGTFVAIVVLRQLSRIVTWVVIASFFALVLNPAVEFLVRRARMKRAPAAFLVFLIAVLLVIALLYAFIKPVVDQTYAAADAFPEFVADAKAGRGEIGRLVQRFGIDDYVERNQDRFRKALSEAGKPALDIAKTVANTIAALLTIMVMTILMLLRGPSILDTAARTLEPRRSERVRRVAADAAKAVTGYVAGNLFISVIAGLSTYVFLWIIGVPFREILGLWVAFADLIPLVGATLGAIPAVGVAFLHSTTAGIATLVFYVLYQQFENHVLQVSIMSKTVDLNPLAVLISVLCGVELFGILGALLAIPVAGIIQVIARDIYDERRGRFKPEPTIGSDEVPMATPNADGSPGPEAEGKS